MFGSAFGAEETAATEEEETEAEEEEPFFLLKQTPMMFGVTQPNQREKSERVVFVEECKKKETMGKVECLLNNNGVVVTCKRKRQCKKVRERRI
jgi:hypothetical protein